MATVAPPAAAPTSGVSAAAAKAARGDKWFMIGCLICGSWFLGPIGAPIMIAGMVMLRQAQKEGALTRPWAVTILGGLMFLDASGNFLLWGTDLFWSHGTILGRSLWIDYGRTVDGGYAINYDHTSLGGVALASEKFGEFAFVLFIMPIKIVASWAFLKMKRWGLQWCIIANWLYLAIWIGYVVQQSMEFPLRFGVSQLGVTGMWAFALIPFMGPLVLLPYLHSVNKELWTAS
jgi:hypothetical protein